MSNFLGLDFSTQKLKAVVVDENLNIVHESEVLYDRQLPEFRTQGGAIKGEIGVVTTPVTLWIKALDLLLDQMKLDGVDFSKVKGLSGAAQQHGAVYWQNNARSKLQNLDSSQFLHQQLQTCFSLKQVPIWMDSSTTKYCKEMEDAVGGPEEMAKITGSRAFERFTGAQIAKLVDQKPTVYENTERISLISSFACSLFLGDYASIDCADASGMNLMNIRTKEWDESCIEATKAPNLETKLGRLVPSHSDLGQISKYYVDRFGFCPKCRVVSFTGDNPATLAGLRLSQSELAVSLGTSDTVIFSLPRPGNFIDAHVMRSPTDPEGFMGLLCFKNGSLTRERIRNFFANGSWDEFSKLLESTPRGNFGYFGLFFDNQEILPFLKKGEYRWGGRGEEVTKFPSAEIEVRALIEGQMIARRSHAEEFGFTTRSDSRIVATGGASQNKSILQVLSDVFNVPVHVRNSGNSAALGSTYLAKMSIDHMTFQEIIRQTPESELICTPSKDSVQIYNPMTEKYKVLVNSLLKSTS